jgi:hypothetical protein
VKVGVAAETEGFPLSGRQTTETSEEAERCPFSRETGGFHLSGRQTTGTSEEAETGGFPRSGRKAIKTPEAERCPL